jgi:hypothetical protein
MRSLFHPSVKQSGVLDRLFGYYPSVCREPDIAVLKIGVRNAPISFSNGSMGSGSFLSDVGAFGCLRSLRAHLALDGVSWVQGGLVEIAVGQVTACYRIDAVICALPGRRSARELGWTSVSLMPLRLYRFELSTVSQHGMHDDREAPSERDPRFSHRRSSGDREGPVLELQRRLVAGQHDVCGLVQKCANPPIAALRDAAGIVDLA